MLKSSKKHFGAVALILVVFLLSGCFGGSKPFNVVVELDPALKGVEIRSGSAQGKVLGTTNEKGVTEFKVDGETTIVPVSEGYTFTPTSEKVTKAGKVSFKATAVEEPALTIESVSPVADISVLVGEAPFAELELPETVEVIMNDETEVELEVEWDSEGYNYEVAGTYTIEGELVLIDGMVNPNNLKAEVKVEVRPLSIDSVSPVAGFSVLIGETPFDELELPETVEVTMNDETKVELEVEWDSEGYDYEVADTYIIEGELTLIDGLTNPKNLKAEVQVRVRYIPENEEDLYDEAGATLNDEMEALDLGAIAEDIELVDTITTVDESVFSVAWASSNPEVLGVDGKINPTAQDEEVVLTATLTLETNEISAQSSADPRVLTYLVTVLADPQKKAIAEAELATAAVEAIEGPTHYDEVAAIEELFEAADAAVALVDDALTRYEFEQRIEIERNDFNTILAGHVGSVNDAETDLDLFEALDAFWTVDIDLIAAYEALVKEEKPTTVHEIQENVVEKAPLFSEEELVVLAVVKAVEGKSLIKFKDTLLQYAAYFERVMFEDNAALNKYKDGIEALTKPTIETIQGVIDAENLTSATAAVVQAEGGVKRADWNKAVALLEFVADGKAKEALQDRLDAHDLIIKVSEATTPAELRIALEDLEIEYVYVTLLDEYMKAIANTANAAKVVNKDGIQDIVNGINEDNVDGILKDIVDIEAETSLNLVQVLLEKLDEATPIYATGAEDDEVDFDLADEDLGFETGRLSFYRAELVNFACTGIIADIAKVKTAITAGNAAADAEFSHFVAKDVKAEVDKELEFIIEAFNVGGDKFDVGGEDITGTKVMIDDTEVALAGSGGVEATAGVVTFTTTKVCDKIGTHAAELTFKYDGETYEFKWDVEVTATADDNHSTVVFDKADGKYVSGEDIEITVTLRYADKEVLKTENGRYDAEISVGKTAYTRNIAFQEGVGVVTVDAREASKDSETFDVIVRIPALANLTLVVDNAITIKHGKAAVLVAEEEEKDIKLTVYDANKRNIVTDYDGEKLVKVSATPIIKAQMSAMGEVDEEGSAWVTFTGGTGELTLDGSDFVARLSEGTYELTIELEDLVAVVEYEHEVEY